jgi:hypothetical protein
LPALENLASGVNAFNAEQIQKMLQSAIPNYNELTAGVSGNINSMLKGEIPQDVQDAIQSNAASKAISGGYSGTGMSHNLVARDLGLTSLDLIQKGIGSAESWLKTAAAITEPNFFNVASMFVTPDQEFNATFQNQQAKFSRNWLNNQIQNNYKWNNVVGASLIKTDEQLAQIAASVAGSAAGAAI